MDSVGRLALRLPVFGWLIQDAIGGLPDAKYYFAGNCALALVALVYVYGYPLLITLAVAAAGLALIFLVYMTAADAFSPASRRWAAEQRRRPRRAV